MVKKGGFNGDKAGFEAYVKAEKDMDKLEELLQPLADALGVGVVRYWQKDVGLPIREVTFDERHNEIPIKIGGDIKQSECYCCHDTAIDHCSNCERPICNKHSIQGVMVAAPSGESMIVLSFCKDCWGLAVEMKGQMEQAIREKKGANRHE